MLGDLTEAKEGHNAHLVNRIVNELTLLSKLARVIILMGNHDYIDPNTPFFEFVKHIPNVKWVGHPCVASVDDKKCTLLPHTNNWKDDWYPKLFTPGGRKVDMVLAHATFKGAVSESGQTLDGVPLDAIPKGLPVIAGDVHVPQDLGRITYVGSPYTIRFGDNFKPRVLLIKNNNHLESIPCPGPQKRLIEASSVQSAMQQINKHPKDILKVRVAWDGGKMETWGAARRDLLDWATEQNISIHGVEAVVEVEGKLKKYKTRQLADDKNIISAYCKANGVNTILEGVGQKIAKE